MIRNIIFDMGNVLLDYNPDVCLERFVEREEDRLLIKKELFLGPEWVQGDLGYLTDEERFPGVSNRVPERLHKQLWQCVNEWDICMKPVKGAKAFCEEKKKQGYRLYVLSNASSSFYRYFPRLVDPAYFDGIVVSCDVHLIKPDIRIFRHLLDTYALKPEECFFIDDLEENVKGAQKAGIQGAVFHGDYEEIRQYFQV